MSTGYLTPIEDLEGEAEDSAWQVPWHARVPVYLLALPMIAAFVVVTFQAGAPSGAMRDWGVSGAALAAGRYHTIASHMFAHGGFAHIFMNMSALFAIGGPLVTRLGSPPAAWLRFLMLFGISGLAGAALFIAIHPSGTVPMLGASGAIYGLLGTLIRMDRDGLYVIPLQRRFIGRFTTDFVRDNLLLFVLLTVPALLMGSGGGVAWEAHLGGFAFGLLAGPRFLQVKRYGDI
jgi:membrane associated rhomboid family serine protease